jgi:4-diphosphocytidyl-2-C-methyl-D-erythritol kinase
VPTSRVEPAPAKVNLTLRVLGRRADGYHELESLVVFAAIGDALTFKPGRELALVVRGPTAAASGDVGDNLVLKAGRALASGSASLRLGRFMLAKRLPVAAGLGGGSADAAAALRLLARANRIALDDPRLMAAARATGADVPVCIDPRPRMMSGIGEILSRPLRIARLPAVLVNPRVSVPTREVFAVLAAPPLAEKPRLPAVDAVEESRAGLIAFVTRSGNDLEAPALKLHPAIGETLASLHALDGCRLARMSGSGATCFALFDSGRAAAAAARVLRARHPHWWIRPTILG